MIIHYRLAGHAIFHVIIGGEVIGNVQQKRLGHRETKMWVAKFYGPLNGLMEFEGRTKYHAVKKMLRGGN